MGKTSKRLRARILRRKRVRRKVSGTTERPRLSVYRSNHHLYAQVIDDSEGTTLVSACTLEKALQGAGDTTEGAKKVGTAIAEKAKAKGINTVVFDRGGYKFHGVMKALADSAREAGLKF